MKQQKQEQVQEQIFVKYPSFNFFILVKKTFFELCTVKKFFFSLGILLFLPLIFLIAPMAINLGSQSIPIVISMIQGSLIFPTFIWTNGAALVTLIAIFGSPLIAKHVNSGSMLLLISKPIRRENIYISKLLGLILYNFVLSSLTFFMIVWIAVWRYTGNLSYFINSLPFLSSLIFYSLVVNILFSTISMTLSNLINDSRIVLVLLIVIMLYCFVLFPFVNLYYTSGFRKPLMYPFDLGYHLGNLNLGLIELFGHQMNIGSWIGEFYRFTSLIQLTLTSEETIYYRTHYITPKISLLIWFGIILLVFLLGIIRIRKKEIHA